jgi:hypothetical protein
MLGCFPQVLAIGFDRSFSHSLKTQRLAIGGKQLLELLKFFCIHGNILLG